jgi:hypothetical protein
MMHEPNNAALTGESQLLSTPGDGDEESQLLSIPASLNPNPSGEEEPQPLSTARHQPRMHSEGIHCKYVVQYQDFAEKYNLCCQKDLFTFHLCDPKNSGSSLDHCCGIIEGMLEKSLLKFKIGVTADPHNRWFSSEMPGYWADPNKFEHMLIMAVFHSGEAAGILERCLIRMFHGENNGCCNRNPGGENTKLNVTTYVYLVYRVIFTHPVR